MTFDMDEENDKAVGTSAEILRLRISLKGRPLRTLSFNQDVITVGRDPQASVFLDNPGISREHLRITRTEDGYLAEDLGSANGTSVNDEAIQRRLLANEDVIRIGKFSLWVGIATDRRHTTTEHLISNTTDQGTMVLSTGDLDRMMTKLREFDQQPPPENPLQPAAAPPVGKAPANVPLLAAVFAVGLLAGVILTWVLTH